MSLNTPKYIIVHHTGGVDGNPKADTSRHTFEIIDAGHRSRGWESNGYHYTIEKKGKTVKNPYRALDYHGAHTKGYNTKSIGIVLAGNFDVFLPTREQKDSLMQLLKSLTKKYNIPISKIVPHRAFSSKSCFGSKLSDTWAQELLRDDEGSCEAELKKKDNLIKILIQFILKLWKK